MKRALVTTGATVTFRSLIENVLENKLLNNLVRHGYTLLIVQYGKPEESVSFLKKLLNQLHDDGKISKIVESNEKNTGVTFDVVYKDTLRIKCIQFDAKLVERFVQNSELVISHAGTGSIMDSFRAGVEKIIVMVNDKLKDNHQQEIADAFESIGLVMAVDTNGGSIIRALDTIERKVQNVSNSGSSALEPNGIQIQKIVMSEL